MRSQRDCKRMHQSAYTHTNVPKLAENVAQPYVLIKADLIFAQKTLACAIVRSGNSALSLMCIYLRTFTRAKGVNGLLPPLCLRGCTENKVVL
jgi:hypothetical protein